jgi:hypothetical protein
VKGGNRVIYDKGDQKTFVSLDSKFNDDTDQLQLEKLFDDLILMQYAH